MKDVKEILAVPLALHVAIDQAKANDGKLDLADIPLLISPLMKIPAAIEGAEKAQEQLKAATPEQRAQTVNELAAEYSISDKKVEEKIEAGIEALLALGKLVG